MSIYILLMELGFGIPVKDFGKAAQTAAKRNAAMKAVAKAIMERKTIWMT